MALTVANVFRVYHIRVDIGSGRDRIHGQAINAMANIVKGWSVQLSIVAGPYSSNEPVTSITRGSARLSTHQRVGTVANAAEQGRRRGVAGVVLAYPRGERAPVVPGRGSVGCARAACRVGDGAAVGAAAFVVPSAPRGGAAKHVRPGGHPGGVPVPDIPIKRGGGAEHVVHGGDLRRVPLADILIKRRGAFEHVMHVYDPRGVPL
mmetsp:Transcript_3201/g.13900  ORF Transcript_3201/g.13900 Transcript_3201/m.13900 type:complete len:206 (+) Transcript_3201:3385-4002(+)